jgi:hypothetical protein
MREAGWIAVAVVLAATAWPALRPGEVGVARQAWEASVVAVGDDPSSRVWVDVAWFQQRVAPWQAGYAEAQARLREVGARRRALLRHDRGGRRHPQDEG